MIMEVAEVLEYENVFEKVIAKGNVYLKVIGLKLDNDDGNRSFMERLRLRRFFIFTFLCVNVDVVGQSTWLIRSFVNGEIDLFDITFVMPCLTVTLLGSVKSYYFLKYVHYIHDVINVLKKLNIKTSKYKIRKREDSFEKKSVNFLNAANKIITLATLLGITAFGVGPLVRMAMIFYKTGEIKLFFPFIFSYPFNAFDIRVWPFLYAQQIWSSIVTVSTIWGPDYIDYALATYIITQFHFLKEDIAILIPKSKYCLPFVTNDSYRVKLKKVVECHNDLMRCADLIEASYTKTILFNVITSSMLICFSLFNITTNDNVMIRAPFTAFLTMVLVQIFLLCYFGDVIMRSSMEVSDAIYKTRWYVADPAVVKDLIFISLRANKPCKFTAYGFSDVNLKTFTKILSTSWSYFALLQTIYSNNELSEITIP